MSRWLRTVPPDELAVVRFCETLFITVKHAFTLACGSVQQLLLSGLGWKATERMRLDVQSGKMVTLSTAQASIVLRKYGVKLAEIVVDGRYPYRTTSTSIRNHKPTVDPYAKPPIPTTSLLICLVASTTIIGISSPNSSRGREHAYQGINATIPPTRCSGRLGLFRSRACSATP
jgi:hypothetical protein